MARHGLAILILALAAAGTAAEKPASRFKRLAPPVEKKGPNPECKKLAPGTDHIIKPAKENGAWGYMADGLVPAAIVRSGDVINLTIPSAAGTLLWDEMIEGDAELEELFRWDERGPAVATRGAFGGAEGQSWNVGPIHMCSAKPGDILQIDFLSLAPRANPKGGEVWGVLASSQSGFDAAGQKDLVTAFHARMDKNQSIRYLMPDYTYTWQTEARETSCVPDHAEYPNTLPEGKAAWTNEKRDYTGLQVPCIDGKQAWDDLTYPGIPVRLPYEEREWGLASRFLAKPNLHIGFAGTAPATGHPVSGDTLGPTGGLLNQKRMVQGTSLYLPVEVKGGQLFLGKGHFSVADGLIGGAAIEGHIEAQIRVTLHPRKEKKTPKWMRKLQGPVVETADTWVVPSVMPAGEAVRGVSADAQNPSTLEEAVRAAAKAAAQLVGDFYEMEPPEVRRAMAFGVDVGVSSLVSGRVSAHAVVDRASMDFFETASALEREVADAEALEALGGKKKCECECEEEDGEEAAAGAAAQEGAGGAGAKKSGAAAAGATATATEDKSEL